jgi:hypothetical protein
MPRSLPLGTLMLVLSAALAGQSPTRPANGERALVPVFDRGPYAIPHESLSSTTACA